VLEQRKPQGGCGRTVLAWAGREADQEGASAEVSFGTDACGEVIVRIGKCLKTEEPTDGMDIPDWQGEREQGHPPTSSSEA